jgi:hypothetical protein
MLEEIMAIALNMQACGPGCMLDEVVFVAQRSLALFKLTRVDICGESAENQAGGAK